MPLEDLVKEAERQLTICNACRYCEGFCAVWPAVELRRTFDKSDVVYLSNLCFDCRACFYACQYAPPHAFDVNIPRVFAQVRAETYEQYAWPQALGRLVKRNVAATVGIVLAFVLAALGLVLAFRGPGTVFQTPFGPETFYRVVPYAAMVLPAVVICAYALVLFIGGAVRFWADTRGRPNEMLSASAFGKALADAMSLAYLRGGGDGCNYPTERFSQARRIFHHLTFYGFLLDLASTISAAIMQDALGIPAPYPIISVPVLLGLAGGLGLLIGTLGLLYLKWLSDRVPADGEMLQMDVGFIVVLLLLAVTGLALLGFRATPAMGTLLAVHLGVVAAFFALLPYGKFAHVVYRYAALVRNSVEQRRLAELESEAAHH